MSRDLPQFARKAGRLAILQETPAKAHCFARARQPISGAHPIQPQAAEADLGLLQSTNRARILHPPKAAPTSAVAALQPLRTYSAAMLARSPQR
tara:strand:- start:2169 stop:2450 length:282 start_codon:yes stop_codon:yes gene_type:complete